MKVSVIRKLIENLDDNAEIYCGYSEDDETHFDMFSEEEIIDRANNQAGIGDEEDEDVEEDVEPIEDIDTALQYLAENDTEYYIMS